MPKVTIDGVDVIVRENATILDAAQKAGIWIPTLCFHPAVSSHSTCRLCMVELDRGDWTQLVTACNYPVRRDIAVRVDSERAKAARRGVMQLLLARAPECAELRALADRMGVGETPYPTVTEAQRNCVLCGLCVRVCEEVMGRSAIGFAGRGVERQVAPPFHRVAEECTACGACVAVCPVGTIRLRIHEDSGEVEISPFKARAKLLECVECGAKLVAEPVAAETLKKVGFDWEEFRRKAVLCPKCRRKAAAGAQGTAVSKRT